MTARAAFRAAVLVLVAVLALLLGAFSTAAPRPVDRAALDLVAESRPTNAAKIFQWGLSAWEDEFIEPLSRNWRTSHRRLVRNQNGMLTLDSTRRSGSVWATVPGHARRYGRWEARVRSEQNGRGGEKYRVMWELIPAGDYACGSKNIEISTYEVGDRRARMRIRTPEGTSFSSSRRRDLGDNVWHTYAVEVTRKRISWFVDTRVVRTERRAAALTGTRFQLRFRLDSVRRKRMNPTRMQMDWVRYYSLERSNAKSVKAPSTRRGSYNPDC